MGKLGVDEPIVFEAHDETQYVWDAGIEPGKEYILSVLSEDFGEEGYYGQIYVYDENTKSDLIVQGDGFTPYVIFTAPEDGTITIVVYMVNWINTDIEVTLTQNDDN